MVHAEVGPNADGLVAFQDLLDFMLGLDNTSNGVVADAATHEAATRDEAVKRRLLRKGSRKETSKKEISSRPRRWTRTLSQRMSQADLTVPRGSKTEPSLDTLQEETAEDITPMKSGSKTEPVTTLMSRP